MSLKFFKKLPRRKKKLLYGLVLFLSDAIFLALSFYLSYHIRFYTTLFSFIESNPSYSININYVFYSTLFIALTLVTMFFFRLYDRDYTYRGSGYYFRIFKAVSINIIIIIIVGYLLEVCHFSPALYHLFHQLCTSPVIAVNNKS